MRVLITDGNCRSALAATRSLGEKGIDVIVGEEINVSMSSASRYCSKSFVYPSPYTRQQEFLEVVRHVIDEESIDMILPMTDVTMEAVLSSGDSFTERLLRALPTYAAYSLVSNKMNMILLARKYGLHVPESLSVLSADEFREALGSVKYPTVVKPALSRVLHAGRIMSAAVRIAGSPEDLLSIYELSEYLKEPFMLQEMIKGRGVGVFALFDHGKPIAYFCHERLRERPPCGGVSVLCRSIELDESLKGATESLLSAVGWNGVAMVEFKVESETGIPYLMEVNGRFWGSLQLAIDSGVDFPWMLCHLDELDLHKTGYQTGKKLRWLLGDLDYLYFRLFKRVGNEGMDNGLFARLNALLQIAAYNGKECRLDVVRKGDMQPCLRELWQYLLRR